MSEQLPFTVKFRVENQQLVPDGLSEKLRLELYLKSQENGAKVEVTYELVNSDASYGQFARVHACIREIARDTGHTQEEIKDLVKQKAGIYSEPGKLRSFAYCSKKELSDAIQAVIEIADGLGINLNQY